jgi:hypothetical protein
MKPEGALTDGSAGCIENTQCAPSASIAHTECEWKDDDSLGSAVVNLDPDREGAYLMFPSPEEPCYVWLRRSVKAQDELAALGLDRRLASHKSPEIRAKESIRYELTQP